MVITSSVPSQNSKNVNLQTVIIVAFDLDIDSSSLDESSITVATKKTNILTSGVKQAPMNTVFTDDEFFNPEFTGIAQGRIELSPTNAKQIIFTPSFRLMPNTEYTVYVAQSIISITGECLDKINTITFTTSAEDITVPLEEPKSYSKLIGTFLQPDTVTLSGFTIKTSKPADQSFLNSRNTIVIELTDAFSSSVTDLKSYISVEWSPILSDYPENILDQSKYSITNSVDRKTITITLTGDVILLSKLIDDIIIKVSISGLPSSSTTLTGSFVFVSTLSAYHASIKLVRLKAGTLLTSIPDLTIALMIYYKSLEANMMTKSLSKLPTTEFSFVKQKWTLYNVLLQLLLNNYQFAMNDLISEQLGEFRISLSNGGKIKLYNTLLNEINKFNLAFNNLANFKFSTGVVKGAANASNVTPRAWYGGIQPGLNTSMSDTHKLVFDEIGVPMSQQPIYSANYYYNSEEN